MPSEDNLQQIEKDLNEFYQFCKENRLSEKEIAQICKPLSERVNNFPFKGYVLKITLILLILYLLSYLELFSWIYSAIGRLFLIELLPYWNWQVLQSEKCLISNSKPQNQKNTKDCSFCEYLETIDVIDSFEIDLIYENYIKLNKPVILENGLENWNIPNLNSTLFDRILSDKVIAKSYPCKFSSNLYFKDDTLSESLKNYKNHRIYFMHFQNCQYDAVKAMRKYFPRPNFLVPEIYPTQYSWLVKSKNYKIEKYKELFFDDSIIIVGQLEGGVEVMLHPETCENDCPTLKINLIKGEVLIFTNFWRFAYLPNGDGDNLQVILETR
nr:uncharacterized protein LOC111413109 isoform X2 [Onthophagus taurus]